MQNIKLFLASSLELKEDRQQFEQLIGRQNRILQTKDLFLNLFICEEGFDAVSQTRSQDEYNKEIRESDIFVMLFYNKVGKYSEEEFDTALSQFKLTGTPLIFTYFKNIPGSIGSENRQSLQTLWEFQDKLKNMQYYTAEYKNIEGLQLDFKGQLEKFLEKDFIELNIQSEKFTPSFFIPIINTSIQNHRASILRYTRYTYAIAAFGMLLIVYFNIFLKKDITDTVKALFTIGGFAISAVGIYPYSQIRPVKIKLAFCEGLESNIDKMNKEELRKISSYILPDFERLYNKS